MLSATFLAAVFCWAMVLWSAIKLAALTPGSRFATFQRLGMWNFEPIRAQAGASADVHILTYKRAFAGFFVMVLLVIGFTALSLTVGSLSGSTPLPSSSASP